MSASAESSLEKYGAEYLKTGMKFTAPVFFDDGMNMFLAQNCAVKAYHIQAITRWGIGAVLTRGKLTPDSPQSEGGVIPVAPQTEQPVKKPSLAESLAESLLASRAAAMKMSPEDAGDAAELEEV
jgi:hypothetical protein